MSKGIWRKVGLLIVLGALVAGVFYWYSWKPYAARRFCSNWAYDANKHSDGTFDRAAYDGSYDECLHSSGY